MLGDSLIAVLFWFQVVFAINSSMNIFTIDLYNKVDIVLAPVTNVNGYFTGTSP